MTRTEKASAWSWVAAQSLFLALKGGGVVDWPWYKVLIPLWAPVAILAVIALVVLWIACASVMPGFVIDSFLGAKDLDKLRKELASKAKEAGIE